MLFAMNFRKGELPCSFINLIFIAPNLPDETTYTEFIENALNEQFPEPENKPDLFELVKTYQIYSYSRMCWKYNKKLISFFIWELFY